MIRALRKIFGLDVYCEDCHFFDENSKNEQGENICAPTKRIPVKTTDFIEYEKFRTILPGVHKCAELNCSGKCPYYRKLYHW